MNTISEPWRQRLIDNSSISWDLREIRLIRMKGMCEVGISDWFAEYVSKLTLAWSLQNPHILEAFISLKLLNGHPWIKMGLTFDMSTRRTHMLYSHHERALRVRPPSWYLSHSTSRPLKFNFLASAYIQITMFYGTGLNAFHTVHSKCLDTRLDRPSNDASRKLSFGPWRSSFSMFTSDLLANSSTMKR